MLIFLVQGQLWELLHYKDYALLGQDIPSDLLPSNQVLSRSISDIEHNLQSLLSKYDSVFVTKHKQQAQTSWVEERWVWRFHPSKYHQYPSCPPISPPLKQHTKRHRSSQKKTRRSLVISSPMLHTDAQEFSSGGHATAHSTPCQGLRATGTCPKSKA